MNKKVKEYEVDENETKEELEESMESVHMHEYGYLLHADYNIGRSREWADCV